MRTLLTRTGFNKPQCIERLTKNVPYTHEGPFKGLLSQLSEKRLQELVEQKTNVVVFDKDNMPDFYKKDVEKDSDTILDSILIQLFQDNPKVEISQLISGDQQSRMHFIENYIEEQ